MTAAGYLLFSGFTGLGDFGTSRDGALYLAQPEWLWRLALVHQRCCRLCTGHLSFRFEKWIN